MNEQMEALRTANEYLENLLGGVKKVVNYIEQGEEEKGIDLIQPIADGIEWLLSAVNLTQEAHKGSVEIGQINEKLGEVVDALENEDFVLVGDLFNYEILPILEDIQNNIRLIVRN
ncbi:MAG: hypothetical protein LKH93_00305 [Clostridium beijerinckii]|jgi:hypothetical protein|uniref:hypothetical protein n=1 Tax=Clostridium beijerinckii TaxID=1520 RepID=UPI001493E3C2|nr:hypothetical protein [Clostridium beijerinckii]MCI1477729.1 hypothetical protein [Clostridium beijerinckii]MCI1577955.1 hypothetical protein [Clostridium beijerinckii]MCI1583136.1 hypothetical protein [Clostridium beijerinckii]MCI1620634.1 hypothetical protein [Clostridium beijerinckii]NOW87871.1 hypothetical protein [Clostridium beijerinckii]